MRAVKGKDTKPEMAVRAFLRSKRFKFETHTDLPGKPDIVLPRHKVVIRVMGCFWHGHLCKRGNRLPKTNAEYWSAKISRNKIRDQKNKVALEGMGWSVIDIWECDLAKQDFFLNLSFQRKSF